MTTPADTTAPAAPTPRRARAHDRRLGVEAARKAREKWGSAWQFLSEDQKDGAVCQQIVAIVMAREDASEQNASLARIAEVALSTRSGQ